MEPKDKILVGFICMMIAGIGIVFSLLVPGDTTRTMIIPQNDHVTRYIIGDGTTQQPDHTVVNDTETGKQTTTEPSPSDRYYFGK